MLKEHGVKRLAVNDKVKNKPVKVNTVLFEEKKTNAC